MSEKMLNFGNVDLPFDFAAQLAQTIIIDIKNYNYLYVYELRA